MLKLVMLQKKRNALQAQIKQLRSKRAALRETETKLKKRVDEAEEITPELEAEVEANTEAITEVDDTLNEVLDQLETVEAQLEELGAAPVDDGEGDDGTRTAGAPSAQRSAAPAAVESRGFTCRSRCFNSRSARDAFYARSEVKDFLDRVRSGLAAGAASRRGVKGAELGIPDSVLELIRDNLNQYSKLINHVRKRNVKGTSRVNVLGDIPEGIWTEMKGALNEIDFALSELELDGFKVGGYVLIDNYLLADSDIALGEEIVYMLSQAIGLALDKAIVFGKGKDGKMPTGFVTRLAETSEPGYWGANQEAWTDLHTSHILQLNISGSNGVEFFRALLAALGKSEQKYSASGNRVWIMNEATKLDLQLRALEFNSAAAMVSGIDGTMPIIGGQIVTLEFMPDNQIAGGFLDNYMLVEREGAAIASSTEVKFLQDKTAYKATARYDGQPIHGESFVLVSYDNTAPVTAVDFAFDYANIRLNALVVTTAAGSAAKQSVVTVAGVKSAANKLMYIVGAPDGIESGAVPGEGWTEFKSGSTVKNVDNGVGLTVVETDEDGKVVSKGFVNAVAHA